MSAPSMTQVSGMALRLVCLNGGQRLAHSVPQRGLILRTCDQCRVFWVADEQVLLVAAVRQLSLIPDAHAPELEVRADPHTVRHRQEDEAPLRGDGPPT